MCRLAPEILRTPTCAARSSGADPRTPRRSAGHPPRRVQSCLLPSTSVDPGEPTPAGERMRRARAAIDQLLTKMTDPTPTTITATNADHAFKCRRLRTRKPAGAGFSDGAYRDRTGDLRLAKPLGCVEPFRLIRGYDVGYEPDDRAGILRRCSGVASSPFCLRRSWPRAAQVAMTTIRSR